MVGMDIHLSDFGCVPEPTVRNHPGDAPLHHPGHEDRSGGRGARVLPTVDNHDMPGWNFLHAHALRMGRVLEHGERVEIFARWNIAERVGLADHVPRLRRNGPHILDELVLQADLEQRGGNGSRRDLHQLVAGLGAEGCGHA